MRSSPTRLILVSGGILNEETRPAIYAAPRIDSEAAAEEAAGGLLALTLALYSEMIIDMGDAREF